jgi:Chaperone of endosialidase/Head domain of trimeric autotransporter adhesin
VFIRMIVLPDKTTIMRCLLLFITVFITLHGIAQNVGIGVAAPVEKLDINGALKIGTTTNASPQAGTLRWNATTNIFEGYDGTKWRSLISQFENFNGVVRSTGNHYTDHFVFGADALPPTGFSSDTLLFFNKLKGAFRVGYLSSSTNWVPDSIGVGSFASGYNTKASGLRSTAMGSNTTASGSYSTAMGDNTTASGISSTAMGINTTALANYSTAMGLTTTASGYSSIAIGHLTISSGTISTAMGFNTTASANYSTAMGGNTTASGNRSTAMGDFTIASGFASLTAGSQTTASGATSTALGRNTKASGDRSTAMGLENIAKGYASTVIGVYNDSILVNDQTAVTQGTPLFIVGNGDDNLNRSNAMVIAKNGRVGLGLNQPLHPVHNSNGALLALSGVWTNASDRRFKSAIKPIHYGLKELMQLQPSTYTVNATGEQHIGFIAQDLKEIIPEVVSGIEGDIKKGETLGVSYGNMVALLTKAIQEQQVAIQQKDAAIAQLKKEMNEQQALLLKIEQRIKALEK